jgi:L-ascorbate metabolism protein UlaG (beta-lactamase superfamily)
VQNITTIGGNLFEVAATQLGSALQWINIARANNLTDPMLSGQYKLVIPSFSSAFSDGIGPQ